MIILLFLLICSCAVSVKSVSLNDFYPYGVNVSDIVNPGSPIQLPTEPIIDNLQGLFIPPTAYYHARGQFFFLFCELDYLRIAISASGSAGEKEQEGVFYSRVITTLNDTTELLTRIQDHVNTGFPNAFPSSPTLVIINTGIGVKSKNSTSQGTDYQLIIASNGNRTMCILMIAAIDSEGASNRGLISYDLYFFVTETFGKILYTFPYDGPKFRQAPELSLNSERKGEYIFQIDRLPPPCYRCKKNMLIMTCEVIRMSGETPPSFCNDTISMITSSIC